MCHTQTLRLYNNQIGDAGVTALAEACARGAMAQLQLLHLQGHSFSDKTKHTMKTAMSKSGAWRLARGGHVCACFRESEYRREIYN